MTDTDLRVFAEEAIRFAAELVRVRSFSGEEGKAIELVADTMRRLGYHSVKLDPVGNVVGSVYGASSAEGKSVLFDVHADTVGVTDEASWTRDPFGGEICGGNLYGRGSVDTKASIAAVLYAGAYLAQSGLSSGSVHVCCSVSEEVLEGAALTPVLTRLNPDYVIVGEPSCLKLAVAQRGRVELVLETEGVSAHSCSPEQGINAVDKMMSILPDIYSIPVRQDDVLGPGILALTSVISSPYPSTSVVPNRATATFDRRLITVESAEQVLEEINRVLFSRQQKDPDFRASVKASFGQCRSYNNYSLEGLKVFPAWRVPQNSDLLSLCRDALLAVSIPPLEMAYRFCTNGSAATSLGIPVIGFGPGNPEVAHLKDEYVPVEDIRQATFAFKSMAESLARGSRQMQLI